MRSDAARRTAFRSPAFALVLLALLNACAAHPPVIANVSYQNPNAAADIRTYRVEFQGMPEFLKPMLRDEASRVLADFGLDYTEGDAHAVLLMTFENRPLQSAMVATGSDSIDMKTDTNEIAARFDARVAVELKDSVSGERLWAGTLSRVHYATADSYMHEPPARIAMRDAFRVIFADLPNRLERIPAQD